MRTRISRRFGILVDSLEARTTVSSLAVPSAFSSISATMLVTGLQSQQSNTFLVNSASKSFERDRPSKTPISLHLIYHQALPTSPASRQVVNLRPPQAALSQVDSTSFSRLSIPVTRPSSNSLLMQENSESPRNQPSSVGRTLSAIAVHGSLASAVPPPPNTGANGPQQQASSSAATFAASVSASGGIRPLSMAPVSPSSAPTLGGSPVHTMDDSGGGTPPNLPPVEWGSGGQEGATTSTGTGSFGDVIPVGSNMYFQAY